MPQIPVIGKLISNLLSVFGILSLPPITIPLIGFAAFILGLLSVFVLLLFSTTAISLISIAVFIFGLFSLLRGLSPRWSFLLALILVSGLAYLLSSPFLFKLKNWARKLTINCSIILLICFVPLLIYFTVSGAWQNFFVGALAFSSIPYIMFPLFFIIFLSRPKIKEQFKK
jgi:hypothetical protein